MKKFKKGDIAKIRDVPFCSTTFAGIYCCGDNQARHKTIGKIGIVLKIFNSLESDRVVFVNERFFVFSDYCLERTK